VRKKLNAMALEFADKNVLIVDDSIVRGTTCREIIQMAKDVGAKKVIMASCAPPIRYPNVYGIDMPSRGELVAHGRTTDEIAEAIGADLVVFQTLEDLVASVRGLNPSIEKFECSVFSGEYVTGGVDRAYLDHLESIRSDNMKSKAGLGAEAPTAASLGGVGGVGVTDGKNGHTTGDGANGLGKTPGGNGNVVTGGRATETETERTVGGEGDSASGAMSGGDTIGLHNSWKQS